MALISHARAADGRKERKRGSQRLAWQSGNAGTPNGSGPLFAGGVAGGCASQAEVLFLSPAPFPATRPVLMMI